MAMRRVVFHYADGTKTGPDVLGFGFTVLAAMRKYYRNDATLLKIYLVTGEKRRGIVEIGGELVEDHLNSKMQIFIGDKDTGYSIEFI